MSMFAKLGQTSVFVAVALLIALAVVSGRYYGPSAPMSQVEVDQAIVSLENMFAKVGVPDGNGGADMPTLLGELRHFADSDDGKPFYMLNLMRWRDEALFRPDTEGARGLTITDADIAYREKLFYELSRNAGQASYLSNAKTSAFNYGVNSEEASTWQEVGLYRYSSRRDFFNMLSSDSYQSIVYLKFAAMGHIVLLPTQPHGLIFNPTPDIPVMLGIIFIIGYLLFLLMWTHRKPANAI